MRLIRTITLLAVYPFVLLGCLAKVVATTARVFIAVSLIFAGQISEVWR